MRVFITLITMFQLQSLWALSQEFSFVGELKNVYTKNFETSSHAPGVFVKFFAWSDEQNKDKCLVYKTPIKEAKGELLIVEAQNCSLSSSMPKKVLASDLEQISITKPSNDQFIVKSNKNNFVFNFPFHLSWKLFSKSPRQRGNLKDGVYCRMFSKACPVVQDSCSQCLTPFVTTSLNRFCATQVQKRCGEVSCGRKNEIACLKSLPTQQSLSCEEAKKYVYCRKGRLAYCEPSGRLICK